MGLCHCHKLASRVRAAARHCATHNLVLGLVFLFRDRLAARGFAPDSRCSGGRTGLACGACPRSAGAAVARAGTDAGAGTHRRQS
jgi:hypothetical protein